MTEIIEPMPSQVDAQRLRRRKLGVPGGQQHHCNLHQPAWQTGTTAADRNDAAGEGMRPGHGRGDAR